ncbi:MAG: NAD(P)H-dependent oxidoreductase [Wenzhouxiangellaceae bacterium]|nr:NAD(P)H-dependent oxidoreductase [Wenzhouxiangellaceae bacterium]
MPALLKAFIEQTLRPGFAFDEPHGRPPRKLLVGRSARLVVSMGMPALIYRTFYRAHSVKCLSRNILKFSGFKPVRTSLVGAVESGTRHRQAWLDRMQKLGSAAR